MNHRQPILILALIILPILLLGIIVTPVFSASDFSISATPTSVTTLEGQRGNSTITVTSAPNYNGTVTLTPQVNATIGLNCILTLTSLKLSKVPGSNSTTLSCAGNTAGGYLVTITALAVNSTGIINHSTTVTYSITTPLFSVAANPTTRVSNAGTSTATSIITVTSIGTFTGTVGLSTITILACGFSATSVTLTAGGTATSTLTCGGPNPGYFPTTVTGTAPPSPPRTVNAIHSVRINFTQIGLVCLADPAFVTTTNACPTSQTFSGPSQAQITTAGGSAQLRVAVAVNASLAIQGFDITLLADHTKLQPFDADITGTILQSPIIFLKCIGGVPKTTAKCSPLTDTADTIRITVTGSGLTTNPTTALLFTAIYNIVGDSAAPITIGFQTGCTGATSLPNTCVSLSTGIANPENIQTATYSTAPGPTPFLVLKSNPKTSSITIGVATTTSYTIGLGEINGFNCGTGINCVNLSTRVPTITGLSASLLKTTLSDPPTNTTTLTVRITAATPAGTYTINVVGGPSLTNPPTTGLAYLGASVSVNVTVVFSPPNMVINSVNVDTATVTTGQTITVTVVVKNTGGTTGTASVSVKWGSVTVTPVQNATIAAGQQYNFTFTWNTAGYGPDTKPITAVVAGSSSFAGSSLAGPPVTLSASPQPFFSGSLIIIIGAVIAAIAVAGLSILLLQRRRPKTASP
jgi:hypothetical protein